MKGVSGKPELVSRTPNAISPPLGWPAFVYVRSRSPVHDHSTMPDTPRSIFQLP
jgi:hypothetical protein